MNISKFIDLIQKRINSVLFRFVLISFAFSIIYLNQNIFDTYIYILASVIYFILYLLLIKHSYLRVINDFLFISLILFDKDPNESLLFTLLILPIINSINFSGQKKSILLYIISILTYLVLFCNFNHNYTLEFVYHNLTPILAIFFLWIINGYTSLRTKIRSFREELNDVIDSFYIEKEFLKRPHKIYKRLISVINKNIKSNLIEDIYCFVISNNSDNPLTIVNSSKFIWSHELKEDNFIEKIRKEGNLYNKKIKIETKTKEHNIIIYNKVENYEFVFFIITSIPIPLYYELIGTFRTLQPAFIKISNVLIGEKKLQELKSKEISKLSQRSQYVNRANKTMHFMRNRLGPFSNIIKQLEGFESVSEEKKEQLKKLMFKEKDRAKVELKNITKRANDMLEKSTNPFSYTQVEKVSIERLYTIFKSNVSSFFPEKLINTSVNNLEKKIFVYINEEGFEMFLSDWLNNIFKYKVNQVDFEFTLKNNSLLINFINDHSLNNSEINQMITDLTSSDRNEIMKRTTHGLFIIKSTLEEMNITFKVKNDELNRLLILQLILKTEENENSNI